MGVNNTVFERHSDYATKTLTHSEVERHFQLTALVLHVIIILNVRWFFFHPGLVQNGDGPFNITSKNKYTAMQWQDRFLYWRVPLYFKDYKYEQSLPL